MTTASRRVSLDRIRGRSALSEVDAVAVEEPLEIRLDFQREGLWVRKSVSLTMRTPGHDFELAAGFLYSEGIIRCREALTSVHHFGSTRGEGEYQNVVRVELAPGTEVDLKRLERHFYTSSSCGVCSKASLEALYATAPPPLPRDTPGVSPEVLHRLPGLLREAQAVFSDTGGLHGAALFDAGGQLLLAREDVGRHNAVDKLIGARLLAGGLPAHEALLLVSGRASFELAQKARMAGIAVLAAVGAPSSLAVDLAVDSGMTLVGFLREGRFNLYSGPWRIQGLEKGAR